MWLVMAVTCANETLTPGLMLNRCRNMSTTKSSMTSRPLSATTGSGGKRHRDSATPRGEKITRHGRVMENGSGRCGLTPGDFLQGEQVVEALLLASGSVAVWMSIQSRGFVRLQVLNHVSMSFAVDVIATSRSCDTASQKRETNTSVVNRICQSFKKLCISWKQTLFFENTSW